MNVNNLWYKYGEINISACQRDEDENLLCHVCLSEEKQKLWFLLDGARKKLSIVLYWKCHNFYEVEKYLHKYLETAESKREPHAMLWLCSIKICNA